jgi:plasmid stability protein
MAATIPRTAAGEPVELRAALTFGLHVPNGGYMSKMIQLRHVPDHLHRKLRTRAAMEGLSLSEFLLREVRRLVERPTLSELRERLAQRTAVSPRVSPARAVRTQRDGR